MLNNKTIFLTGAAHGIGAACARFFIKQEARVFLVDRDKNALVHLYNSLPQENVGFACIDVTNSSEIEKAVQQMHERWGKIDVLINNAGITRDALTEKMSASDFDTVIAVNLKAPLLCTQAVLPFMKQQQQGVILNAASVSATGNVGQANYAASKNGLIAMTRTWAMEFARYNIRVNAVAPGFTDTEMVTQIPEHVMNKLIQKVPLRRLARPEEVAATYAFLASDYASFITGQTLSVDGGLTCGF